MLTIGTLYSLKGNLRCLYLNYYILSRIKTFCLNSGEYFNADYSLYIDVYLLNI